MTPSDEATTQAASPFRRWISRAERLGDRRVYETGIPMRDGAELAADVYLPAEVGDDGVPAIVEVTPYGKDNVALMGDDAELYQNNGYVFVAVDVRGRGKSEGEWIAFANDAKDTCDAVEWVAAQPWCNGKIGTTGLSYMGWVQWAGRLGAPAALAGHDLDLGGGTLAAGDPIHERRFSAVLRMVVLCHETQDRGISRTGTRRLGPAAKNAAGQGSR